MVFPGQPLRPSARKTNQAHRAGALFDELYLARDGRPPGPLVSVLELRMRNAGAVDIPAFGLVRWAGAPLQAATLDGEVPLLELRTTTDATAQVGVAPQQILAADAGADPAVPAGIGRVIIQGACWARCLGPIEAGDALEPNEDHVGVRSDGGATNAVALADLDGYDEGIIPVSMQPIMTCGRYWIFSAEGLPAGGTSEWDVTFNGVTEAVTFPCPCTAAQTRAALETHSEITPDEIISILGGTLPTSSQKVLFRTQPTDISLVTNSLTRSWTAPPSYYWDIL